MAKPKLSISRFVLEIFSIFLGVTIAFLASHWNEQRKEGRIERKTLEEIRAGLSSDINDIRANVKGHTLGITAVELFERYMHNEPVDYDSLGIFYRRLYSDYISITNTTAYETLQSRGLEIISNDQLRSEIVSVYDFAYEIIQKLEEEYYPAQFHKNYFDDFSDYFKKYMVVEDNEIRFMKAHTEEPDAKIILILTETKFWRNFVITSYVDTEQKILKLIEEIDNELEK